MVTTNPIYHCEELEDAVSVYDELEENQYSDLNEQAIYLDVLADETEGCDQNNKPELPSPRGDCAFYDKNQVHDYEGLKEKPDHVYLHVLNDVTEGCEGDREETKPQEKFKRSTIQDQDNATQLQSHEQATKPQE